VTIHKVFNNTLQYELTPLLDGLGFKGENGVFEAHWSDSLALIVEIRESKWNRTSHEGFEIFVTSLMIDEADRGIRWIWQTTPDAWRLEPETSVQLLQDRLSGAIFSSAFPLAVEAFGPPSSDRMREAVDAADMTKAHLLGKGYLKDRPA